MKVPVILFFVVLLAESAVGRVQRLQCESYDSTCGPPSNASCISHETCVNSQHDQEPACMAVWTNDTQTGFQLLIKTCWSYQTISGNPCVQQDACVNDNKVSADSVNHLFCCCTKPMCNNRIMAIPPPIEPLTTVSPPEFPNLRSTDPEMFIILCILTPICALALFVVAGYFAYRKYRLHRYIRKAQAVAQSDAMTSNLLGMKTSHNISQRSPVRMIEVVAQGRFGKVWRGSLGDKDIAVKVFPQQDADSWVQEQDIFAIEGMKHCNNILYFIAAETRGTGPQTEYWLLTTYHKHGSLTDYLKSHELTLPQALHMIYGILNGLTFLHEEILMNDGMVQKPTIVHRDFKSRNVLLKDDLSACIADFGLALKCEHGRTPQDTHGQVGTRRYMSPEVLEGATEFSAFAFRQIDVYACALVIWEVVTRTRMNDRDSVPVFKLPFEDNVGAHPSLNDMQTAIVNQKKRPHIQNDWLQDATLRVLAHTMEEMWDTEPEARITAGCAYERVLMLFKHPHPYTDAPYRMNTAPPEYEEAVYQPTTFNIADNVHLPTSASTTVPAVSVESAPLITNITSQRI